MDHLAAMSEELQWSDWTAILPTEDLGCIPEESGILRIGYTGASGLQYVGRSNHNLRNRIRRIGYEVKKNEMPFTDPVSAAPCLWAMKQELDGEFHVSWCDGFSSSEVNNAKHAYLTMYQKVTSQSPTANYGRMFIGYSKSGRYRDGERGSKSSGTSRRRPIGTIDVDLNRYRNVTSEQWLGISWRGPMEFRPEELSGMSYSYPKSDGVFRVWKEENTELEAIGTTKNLGKKIPSVVEYEESDILVSFNEMDFSTESERKHIESLLVGSHYLATETDIEIVDDEPSKIRNLINSGEGEKVEFKQELPGHKANIVKEILSIANTDGGKILMGVSDDGEVVGVDDKQSMKERIRDLVKGHTRRRIPIDIESRKIEDDQILMIEVPRADELPYASGDGVFYIRNGPQRDQMSGLDLEEWIN